MWKHTVLKTLAGLASLLFVAGNSQADNSVVSGVGKPELRVYSHHVDPAEHPDFKLIPHEHIHRGMHPGGLAIKTFGYPGVESAKMNREPGERNSFRPNETMADLMDEMKEARLVYPDFAGAISGESDWFFSRWTDAYYSSLGRFDQDRHWNFIGNTPPAIADPVVYVSSHATVGSTVGSVEAEDTTGRTATAALEISVFDNPQLWNDLILDRFEFPDVLGNWAPNRNKLADKGGGGHIGNQSLPLSTDSGLTAIVSAEPMDLGGAAHMKIDFRVRALSQDSGESLRINCSNDGGSSWRNVKRYDVGTDLLGGMWEARMLVLDNEIHGLSSDVKVRFRIEGSSNKRSVIFLDNICIARSKDVEAPSTFN